MRNIELTWEMELNEWHLANVIIERVRRRGIASFEIISMENDYNFVLGDSEYTYRVSGDESTNLMQLLIDEMNFVIEIIAGEMLIMRQNPESARRPFKILPPGGFGQ
jgi:hypothetical protein